MLTSQTKNKSQLSVKLTKLPKWHPIISLHLSSQSCETTRFQTASYVTIPSENFSLVGYKKDSIRKGGRWFSVRANHPFSFNKFPFSCLTARLALFFSALALHSGAETRKERSTSGAGAPLTSPPPWGSPPLDLGETEKSSRAGLSTFLAGRPARTFHPHTSPHFIHQLQG